MQQRVEGAMEQAQPNDLPPLPPPPTGAGGHIGGQGSMVDYLQNGNMHYSFMSMNKQQMSHLSWNHSDMKGTFTLLILLLCMTILWIITHMFWSLTSV